MSGTVVLRDLRTGDFAGAPGIVVRVLGTSAAATTDARGFFLLNRLPLGRFTLSVERRTPGAAAARVLDPVDLVFDGQTLSLGDIRLLENGDLEGTIVRGFGVGTSSAAEGALVMIAETAFKAISDGRGRFILPGLPEGTFDLIAFLSGHAPARLEGVRVVPGSIVTARDLRLEPSVALPRRDLSGQVTLLGATDSGGVEVRLIDETAPESIFGPVETTPEGRYLVPSTPVGIYRLRFSRPGYGSAELSGVAVLEEGIIGLMPVLLLPVADGDLDGDGSPDAIDTDDDNDGCQDDDDGAPADPFFCTDTDGDGLADELDADDDADGLEDAEEVGPGRDGFVTDSLRSDTDGDGVLDGRDLCPTMVDPRQPDEDGDGRGDVCFPPSTEPPTPLPTILSLSSTVGAVGDMVQVLGSNFIPLDGFNVARFGQGAFAEAEPGATSTFLEFVVPPGAASGEFQVFSGGLRAAASGATNFTVLQPPRIVRFSPPAARSKVHVAIFGERFSPPFSVTIGDMATELQPCHATVEAVAQSDGLDVVCFAVPIGARTGPLRLSSRHGEAVSAQALSVLSPPRISRITPNPALRGQPILITGSGFGSSDFLNPAPLEVKFTGSTSSVVPQPNSTDNALVLSVPGDARTGPITVLHPSGPIDSGFDLTIDDGPASIFRAFPGLVVEGDNLQLFGAGLAGATQVTFAGGAVAPVIAADVASIRLTVPTGVRAGPVTASLPGGVSVTSSFALPTLERSPTVVFTDINGMVNGGGFSLDQSRVFLVHNRPQTAVILDSTNLSVVTRIPLNTFNLGPAEDLRHFEVAPDGQRGILATLNRTFVVDLPGFALRGSCSDAPPAGVALTFSPDGRFAFATRSSALLTNEQGIFAIDLSAGTCSVLLRSPVSNSDRITALLPFGLDHLMVFNHFLGMSLLDVRAGSPSFGSLTTPYMGLRLGLGTQTFDQLRWDPNEQYFYGFENSWRPTERLEPLSSARGVTIGRSLGGIPTQLASRRWVHVKGNSWNQWLDLVSGEVVRDDNSSPLFPVPATFIAVSRVNDVAVVRPSTSSQFSIPLSLWSVSSR